MAEGDGEDQEDDEDEGEFGAGLALDVGGGEALDRDEDVEGVVVQGAEPSSAEPEDGPFDDGGQVRLLGFDGVAVYDEGDEGGREEAADDERGEGGVVGVVWRVGDQADVEEEHGKDGGEEDGWGGGAEGEDGGEAAGDGEEWPAKISDAFRGEAGDESEGFWEAGVEGDALDAVSLGRCEIALFACEQSHAASALVVAHKACVDGCLAYKGVATVDRIRD